mmetsp:Transcript_1839/g.7242  ORF Transcript_1839/g.7242 Transcript_1839/m.7242 type:complete len:461 (-) Transcript_1839:74-1456(-)
MRLLLFPSNLEGAQAKRLKLDKTSSVLLVVRTTVFFERGETIVVESVGSLATDDDDVALVEFGAHRTGDAFGARVDGGLHHFAFRGEPETVVDEFSVLRHHLILVVHLTAIEADGFERAADGEQNRPTGRLVHASRLHADKARFNNIQAPNAVVATELVELGEHIGRGVFHAIDGHRVTLFELDFNVRRLIRGVLRAHRSREHIFRVFNPRILQSVAFVRNVQQIGIGGVRSVLTLRLRHRDPRLVGVRQQLGSRVQIPFSPRRDHLDVRLQAVISELESNLIVPFPSRPVAHRIGANLLRNFNLSLRDERSRDGRPQQIRPFVQRVRSKHREHVVPHELLSQIVHEYFLDTELRRFRARRFEFFSLPQVRRKRHDFAPVRVLQPLQDDGRVQATGVRQDDFFHVTRRSDAARDDVRASRGLDDRATRRVRLERLRRDGRGGGARDGAGVHRARWVRKRR